MKALILLCMIGAAVAVEVESVVHEVFVEKNQKESATTAVSHAEESVSQVGSVLQGGADFHHPAKPAVVTVQPVPLKPVDVLQHHEPVPYPFYPGSFYPFSFFNFPYCNREFQAPFYNYPPYHADFFKFPQYNYRYPQYPFPTNFNEGFPVPPVFAPGYSYSSQSASVNVPHETTDFKSRDGSAVVPIV